MSEIRSLLPAARQAAALCQAVQRAHIRPAGQDEAVKRKVGAEPVTIADYGAQAILCRWISRLHPQDAVIAEEGSEQFLQLINAPEREEVLRQVSAVLGEAVSETQLRAWLDHGQGREAARTWVIDPIDGTKGFIALRHYVVAVGLLDAQREVVAGLLAAPGWPGGGQLLYTLGDAALMEPLEGGASRRLQVSQRSEPAEMLLMESYEPATLQPLAHGAGTRGSGPGCGAPGAHRQPGEVRARRGGRGRSVSEAAAARQRLGASHLGSRGGHGAGAGRRRHRQ